MTFSFQFKTRARESQLVFNFPSRIQRDLLTTGTDRKNQIMYLASYLQQKEHTVLHFLFKFGHTLTRECLPEVST